jgi:hypothetical protein
VCNTVTILLKRYSWYFQRRQQGPDGEEGGATKRDKDGLKTEHKALEDGLMAAMTDLPPKKEPQSYLQPSISWTYGQVHFLDNLNTADKLVVRNYLSSLNGLAVHTGH